MISGLSSHRDILASLCACLGPFAMGTVLGYSSPAIPELERKGILTPDQSTWFASLITIGALVGGPLGGIIISKYGRKAGIMLTSFLFTIGWVLIYVSRIYIMLYCGRLLTGFACGIISLCVPLYTAEVSHKSRRGRLVATYQIGTTSGILFVYSVGLVLDWKWTAIICSCFPVLMSILMLWMPETPRWLLTKNKTEETLTTLRWLRGDNYNVELEKEFEEIQQAITLHSEESTWKEFTKKYLYKPLIISVSLMFFQQFCGINVVIFYIHSIFLDAGWQGNPGIPAVIAAAVKVCLTILSVATIDKFGRRILFVAGGILLSLSCAGFGTYFYLEIVRQVIKSSISWLSLTSLIVYVAGFSIGWGPVPMVAMAELLPLKARSKASTIANFVNWLCAFIVTKEFLALEQAVTFYGLFWMFGGICVLGTIFAIAFLPETKGQTLEEIEFHFAT